MNRYLSSKAKRIIKFVLTVIIVLLCTYICFRLSNYFMPFIIAYILSLIMEPLIRFLVSKLKLKRKIAALISLLLLLVVFGLVLSLIISKLITEIKSMVLTLPRYFAELYNNIIDLAEKLMDIYEWLPSTITDNIGSIISNLYNTLLGILNSIVGGAFATAISLPEVLIFLLITILATYFISSDKEKIHNYIKSQLPDTWVNKIAAVKNDLFSAIFGYLKAFLIIMSITFVEIFIGLTIIRVRYSLLLAIIISIIDILPILGTGTVLIPWSLYSFFTGNIRMGISILILYVVVTIVRQVIEPKIVSQQIGVYPLLTLMASYVGLKLLGVLGLFLGPITFLLLKNILSGLFKNRSLKEIIGKPSNNK
ncbi:MAG TPA: sporulation integral membrane protein YtvI [Clostridiaceae bacterium]|nr:sporulation integral membrane protein YtvI [Clostridiaceae bacterium]